MRGKKLIRLLLRKNKKCMDYEKLQTSMLSLYEKLPDMSIPLFNDTKIKKINEKVETLHKEILNLFKTMTITHPQIKTYKYEIMTKLENYLDDFKHKIAKYRNLKDYALLFLYQNFFFIRKECKFELNKFFKKEINFLLERKQFTDPVYFFMRRQIDPLKILDEIYLQNYREITGRNKYEDSNYFIRTFYKTKGCFQSWIIYAFLICFLVFISHYSSNLRDITKK